jgi:tetratricopeptide (TPR) repeat protein
MRPFKKPTKLTGDNHLIIKNKKSKKLIIFFSATGTKANSFNFFAVGNELDCNVLFINNGKNEWYQEGIPSLGEKFSTVLSKIQKWIDYLGITEVYTCGQSMGAYGALLYGIYLNAKVLAFGPELELNEEGGRTTTHVKTAIEIKFNIIELISHTSNKIYIYAGEDDPIDIYQVSKVSSFIDFPNISLCTLVEQNHNIAKYLKIKHRLTPLLEDFIANKQMPKMPEEGYACTIDGFSEVYYKQAYNIKNRAWKSSLKYGEDAVQKHPTCPYAQYMLGLAYLQTSRFVEALSHLSVARALVPSNLEYQFTTANCMHRMGHLIKARYLHQKTLQVNKDHAKTHYDLSILYSKMGDTKGAIARAKHALHIEPMNASFKKRVEKLIKVKKK